LIAVVIEGLAKVARGLLLFSAVVGT